MTSISNLCFCYPIILDLNTEHSNGNGTKLHNHGTSQTNVIGEHDLQDLGFELRFSLQRRHVGLVGVIYRDENDKANCSP